MRTRRSLQGWLLVALACGALHGSAAQAQSPEPRNLQRIDYAILGMRTVVRLTFNTELKERPPVVATHHPAPNITMDFADTSSLVGRDTIEVGQRELHSIQILRAGNRVRVVVKLTVPVPHEIELAGRELLLTLQRPIRVSAIGNQLTAER